ncbi:hypothetical protein Nepgr_004569 [Nepenthes gracilis]|uniref:Uncharacterized protein n=1 Tax=Nepenthes gracilis TaxID=150966 RepID=A0AAD3XFF3_NEPGR|nr:hypothetical protein Nepgr_004569 [Nepenthes gracilis]
MTSTPSRKAPARPKLTMMTLCSTPAAGGHVLIAIRLATAPACCIQRLPRPCFITPTNPVLAAFAPNARAQRYLPGHSAGWVSVHPPGVGSKLPHAVVASSYARTGLSSACKLLCQGRHHGCRCNTQAHAKRHCTHARSLLPSVSTKTVATWPSQLQCSASVLSHSLQGISRMPLCCLGLALKLLDFSLSLTKLSHSSAPDTSATASRQKMGEGCINLQVEPLKKDELSSTPDALPSIHSPPESSLASLKDVSSEGADEDLREQMIGLFLYLRLAVDTLVQQPPSSL